MHITYQYAYICIICIMHIYIYAYNFFCLFSVFYTKQEGVRAERNGCYTMTLFKTTEGWEQRKYKFKKWPEQNIWKTLQSWYRLLELFIHLVIDWENLNDWLSRFHLKKLLEGLCNPEWTIQSVGNAKSINDFFFVKLWMGKRTSGTAC